MAKDKKAAEKTEKKLFSLDIFEFETEDGGVDHRVEVRGNYKGLGVQFDATIDQIRAFFTEKRKMERKLQAVP